MTALEQQIHRDLLQTNDRLANEILQLKAEVQWLKEQVGLAKKRLFGPSSEQNPPGQEALLFNEAEVEAAHELPAPESETVTYTRRKSIGHRELQLADLPVEEIDYDLPEEDRICPACAGPMHEMGADVRQEIKIVPPSITLVKHNRTKYACRRCDRNAEKTPILAAPMPIAAFPNSLASPSAVAYIMCQKFVESSPLYRQEQSLHRLGFDIPRQTMANWMIAGAAWLEHIYARMYAHLLERDILHADETPVQVLEEAGRDAQKKSYMWLYRSGRYGPPIVLFDYQQTREGEHPRRFLTGYRGYLQADGYAGYEGLPGVVLSGCFAHARREFVDAISVLPEPVRNKGETSSHRGLVFCSKLYAIERSLHDASPEERHAARQERSQPVLDRFRVWLDGMAACALPKSPLGGAVQYCRNQWPKLITFMEDGRLEIDNNRAERSIKAFVIGRKNWLFANKPRGARASSVIYSIVETAKENGLSPLTYLTHLFEKLPNIKVKDPAALDQLMPWADHVQSEFRVPTRTKR